MCSSADVWCDTTIQVVKVSMLWTINDFKYLEAKSGKFLRSSTFTDHEDSKTKWFLELYPNGHKEDIKEFVSLFLCLESSERKEIQTKFSFFIIDKSGEKTNKFEANHSFKEGGDWGYSRYLVKSSILEENNGLIVDNKLTILCELSFNSNPVTVSGRMAVSESYDYLLSNHRSIIDDMLKLWTNPKYSDVDIIVDGKEFKVHKLILQIRSPVFEAMFKYHTEESKNNRVVIDDINSNVFQEFLKFLYTGDKYALNMDLSADLLVAADRYNVPDLKYVCERYITTKLTVDNVCENLLLADKYSAEELKARAIEYIKNNAHKVVKTKTWSLLISKNDLLNDCFIALALKADTK